MQLFKCLLNYSLEYKDCNVLFVFQPKCARYWPEPNESNEQNCFAVYDKIHVKFIKITHYENDYVLREFTISKNKSEKCQTVYQFQYLAWSDHGVPENQSNTLKFVEHFNTLYNQLNNQKPITVVSIQDELKLQKVYKNI